MRLAIILLSSILLSSNSVYEIALKTLDGQDFNLSGFRGKKILVVNTASKCGFTGQYEELQKLHEKYSEKLAVVGMPCNQFMMQEPGSNEKIAAFCKKNYGVTFTMLEKADVKGKNQHPLYQWLTQKDKNGVLDAKVSWNFNKFLIDENGNLLAHFESSVKPLSEEITKYFGN